VERYILVALIALNLLQVFVMAFHYAMNIRARKRQSDFDLEWQLIPFGFETDWFIKPENLSPADLQNIDKGVVISPKICEPLILAPDEKERFLLRHREAGFTPLHSAIKRCSVEPSIQEDQERG